MAAGRHRILVVGGTTFIGKHITAALLAEGATVQLIVRDGTEAQIQHLRNDLIWRTGDVWNPASLKGQARGVATVIHTVGSLHADPARGFTHHYLNFLSLRNVANMCVQDGAQHLMFISAARGPWLPRSYTLAKREAESYIARVGLKASVVRAPLLFQRGKPRPASYQLVSVLSALTPFGHRSAPLPVDVFARGVARLAMQPHSERSIFYARDLRRLNTREERRGTPIAAGPVPKGPLYDEPPVNEADTRPNAPITENDSR